MRLSFTSKKKKNLIFLYKSCLFTKIKLLKNSFFTEIYFCKKAAFLCKKAGFLQNIFL